MIPPLASVRAKAGVKVTPAPATLGLKLMVKLVPSMIEVTIAPAGIPVPVIGWPTTRLAVVEAAVTVLEPTVSVPVRVAALAVVKFESMRRA